MPQRLLPTGYQHVGVLNLCGAAFALLLELPLLGRPQPIATAETMLAVLALALTAAGLGVAGLGLLQRDPRWWRLTRIAHFIVAPVLLLGGLLFGWELTRELIWPTDAQSGMAMLILPAPAATILWAGVLVVVGRRLGRYIREAEGMPAESTP